MMTTQAGSFGSPFLKQDILALVAECKQGFGLEKLDKEQLRKILHIARESVDSLAEMFNDQEKLALAETCFLLNKSISLQPKQARQGNADLAELVGGFDRIINLAVLSCKTHSGIKNALSVLNTEEDSATRLEMLGHWISVNKSIFINCPPLESAWKHVDLKDLLELTFDLEFEESIVNFLKALVEERGTFNDLYFEKTLPEHRFEALKLCVTNDVRMIMGPLRPLTRDFSQEQRFELAKLCASQDGKNTALFIINSRNLFSQKQRFELAMQCANQFHSNTAKNIAHFGDLTPDQRFEVIKCFAQQNTRATTPFIKAFGDFTPDQRFEIAKLCAGRDPLHVLQQIGSFGDLTQEMRFELAKLCAKKNPLETVLSIQNFGDLTEGQRLEVAEPLAEKFGKEMASNILNIHALSQVQRFELAKLFASQEANFTGTNIHIFGDLTREQRFEIAMVCAKKYRSEMAVNIKNFGDLTPVQLFEVAKLCATIHGSNIAANIQNFGDLSRGQRFEIAKLSAMQDAFETTPYIQNFGDLTQVQRFELAKLCAERDLRMPAYFAVFGALTPVQELEVAKLSVQNNPLSILNHMNNFACLTPRDRFEVLMLCAQHNGSATASYIQNFSELKEKQQFEIAKLCAQQDGSVVKKIDHFPALTQDQCFEVLKLCAKQNARAAAACIENFRYLTPEQLFEVLKLSAKQDAKVAAEHIKKFGDLTQEQIFEVAKLCAEQDGSSTARLLENFGDLTKEQQFELAKLCALQDGRTASYIKNFPDLTQEELFEVLKLCAQQHGGAAARHIKNFGALSQMQQFEVAQLCAQQNGGETAWHIPKFADLTTEQRFEVAKLCSRQNGRVVAEYYFKSFGTLTKEQQFEVAILCAQQSGAGTAEFIKNFADLTQEQRFEVAKLSALDNGETAAWMQNFTLDGEQTMQVFLNCLKQNGLSLFHLIHSRALGEEFFDSAVGFKGICECYDKGRDRGVDALQFNGLTARLKDALLGEIKAFIAAAPYSAKEREQFAKIVEEIEALSSDQQSGAIAWLLSALFCNHISGEQEREWIASRGLWKELFHLHAPKVRSGLTTSLVEMPPFKAARELANRELRLNSALMKRFPLVAIPLMQLCQMGLPEEVFKEGVKKLTPSIADADSRLKDGNVQTNLLKNMGLLLSESQLSETEKVSLMTRVLKESALQENQPKTRREFEKSLKNNLAAIGGMILLEDIERVKRGQDPLEFLGDLFQESFQAQVPIKKVGDFGERYEEIFGSCRNPDALLIYAAGIRKLKDDEAMHSFCSYVETVIEGTFMEARYRLEKTYNLHLCTLFEGKEEALAAWRKPFAVPLKDLVGEEEEGAGFSPASWLQEKLIQDGHLTQDLSYFKAYIAAGSLQEKKEVLKSMGKEQAALHGQGRDMTPLMIQKTLMRIFDITDHKKQKRELVSQLAELMKRVDNQSEFYNDVVGLSQQLQQEKKQIEELMAVISDDPIDLLLLGTDVSGSCQRVDGDPNLNKGLLGYLLDGKNLVAAIKNPNGKIVARCMLRLLWDGERPVLFRERMYPSLISSEQSAALNKLAEMKAAELGIPLTTGEQQGNRYGKPLSSLGGPAPYEYSDAARGVQRNGVYTITEAFLR